MRGLEKYPPPLNLSQLIIGMTTVEVEDIEGCVSIYNLREVIQQNC